MDVTVTIESRGVAFTRLEGGVGVPLVLVHGHTGARDDFEGVMPALAEDRPVVAVDLPGHGGSEGPDEPEAYDLGAQADWLVAFADAVELERFHLLGHSMGGLIAQRVALRIPERLASLVLMGTGLGALREEAREFIERVADVAWAQGVEAAFEEGMRSWEEAPVDPALKARRAADREYLRRRYLKLNRAAIVGGARELATAYPVAHELRLEAPALVVHGEDDYAWETPEQQALAEAIPGAERVAIPVSYHSPQKENPAAWLAVVRGFLDKAERDPRAVTGSLPAI